MTQVSLARSDLDIFIVFRQKKEPHRKWAIQPSNLITKLADWKDITRQSHFHRWYLWISQ